MSQDGRVFGETFPERATMGWSAGHLMKGARSGNQSRHVDRFPVGNLGATFCRVAEVKECISLRVRTGDNALDSFSVAVLTDECHSQWVVRAKPLLCASKVKITGEAVQVDGTLIECLGAINYRELAIVPELGEYRFDR
jgi:hypothetical protein